MSVIPVGKKQGGADTECVDQVNRIPTPYKNVASDKKEGDLDLINYSVDLLETMATGACQCQRLSFFFKPKLFFSRRRLSTQHFSSQVQLLQQLQVNNSTRS